MCVCVCVRVREKHDMKFNLLAVSGVVLSVKRQAEKKIEREKHMREACEQELNKFRSYCSSLEGEIEYLHRLLKQHGIQYTEKIQKRPVSSQISVEVEVNHRADQNGAASDGKPASAELDDKDMAAEITPSVSTISPS